MGKPTVHDIARTAGVSLATVDRVLNGRPGVRSVTVEKVTQAIARLGYVRDLTAANLARQRQYRFVFFLPDGSSQFVTALRAGLAEANQSGAIERTSLRPVLIPEADPHAIAREIAALDATQCDGVAIMAPETPQLRDAVAHLKEQGLAVVALVSDLPNSGCDHFVGINNIAAGRTAGLLLGRFACRQPGKLLVVTSSLQARDSLERRLGFDAVVGESFPELEVLPTLETHADPERMTRGVSAALDRNPEVRGIYSIATGTQALVAALAERPERASLSVVVHELTPFSRQALIDRQVDCVITQNVGHLVRSAVRTLRAKCDGLPTVASQERIRIEIVLRENLQ